MTSVNELLKQTDEFENILAKTGTLAYEKQTILSDVLNGDKGTLNLEDKTIDFKDYKFPIQIIGTLSLTDNMWHWAWDNEDVGFDEDLLEDAKKIKEIGEEYNIEQFTNKILSNVDVDAVHSILMPVATLTESTAYYGVQEDQFLIFVTIHTDELPVSEDLASFAEFYNNFTHDYQIDPKDALEAYAKLKNYDYKDEIEFAVVKTNQQRVIVGFSEHGKVTNIQTML